LQQPENEFPVFDAFFKCVSSSFIDVSIKARLTYIGEERKPSFPGNLKKKPCKLLKNFLDKT